MTRPDSASVADERWAWVALALIQDVAANARRYHDLLRTGPPVELFGASHKALAGVVGEGAALAMASLDWRRAARQQAAAADRCGARLVLLEDPAYPPSLRAIDLPPPFLLVRGSSCARTAWRWPSSARVWRRPMAFGWPSGWARIWGRAA